MKLSNIFSFLKKSKPLETTVQPKAQVAWGGYEAATFTRDRSFIFSPSEDAINNPGEFTRHEITRMTRYVVANYGLAERIMSVAEIYGVGGGLIPNPATVDPEYNKAAGVTFSNWADSVFCTNDNEYTLWQCQRIIARELLICGEVFIVLVKAPSGYPQIMLVPSERVRHSGKEGDTSHEGIYFDSYGKALAYNIFSADNQTSQKVDASNVIHLKRAKNIGQLRGIGAFCSSLNSLRDEKDCNTLIKRSLKTHLALAAFVQKKTPEAGSGLASGLIPVDPQSQAPTTGATNQALERAFGGQVIYGQPGEDIKLLTSEHPTENILAFMDRITRDVCLSISLPWEFVVSPEKLNGTAMRFVINDASFFFSSLQNIIIEGAMNRIYGWVISCFIKLGKLQAPANDVLPYDTSYTTPISLTVDQGRASTAELGLVNAGLMTREQYFSARGRNWKQEMDQWLAELAYTIEQAKAKDLPLELVIPELQNTQSHVDTPEEEQTQGKEIEEIDKSPTKKKAA